jgi:ABC-type sulfate transport system substrate-binding protein
MRSIEKIRKNLRIRKFGSVFLIVLLLVLGLAGCGKQDTAADKVVKKADTPVTLLNVSYDPTREFYKEF